MESNELIKAWQDSEKSLEKLWTLNLKCIEMVQTQKAKSKLNTLVIFKLVAILLGVVFVLFLGFLVYINHLRNLYFSISIAIILLINLIAIYVYLRHAILIRKINLSETLVDTQEKIATLQSSTIVIYRIAWLQLPFWSTWFWNTHWIVYHSLNFWLIPFPITLIFILLALWLFKNISLENSQKKWFRLLLSTEWVSIIKAIDLINEIESFKQSD
jgi:hypothetical protein